MAQFHLPTIEEEQLKKWEELCIFRQILERKENPRGNFVFFEGPPTANGKPGIHHLLTRTFKDAVLRFRTMQGFHIDRKAGWDTHGLPVELEVEKELGFTKKQDIEEYGIAEFNAKCRESVWKYLDLWQKSTKRVGFWVDLDDPYVTYKNDYIETLWWIIKQTNDKNLLYKGYRVTPHCPRCVTSLSSHELAQGYKDVKDPSVYVKFPVMGKEKTFFLVWTTTPWTLPGNVAIAAGSDIVYVEAKMKANGETYILAKDRLNVLKEPYDIVAEKPGAALTGLAYAPLFPVMGKVDGAANAYKVYTADFVSTADGTGLVHIAPAFGEDDAKLGDLAGLPPLFVVDLTGNVTADVPGKGKFFKDADADIATDLVARRLMYGQESHEHSYPFCWRCSTPVIYYAKFSWYLRMSSLRDRLTANNAKVNWVPSHIRDGRFGEWLREAKDWALSRERYWGTPLPIWECSGCPEYEVVGSFKEMETQRMPGNAYFLVRHGGAEQNEKGILSSWPEKEQYHLTVKGRKQVQKVAQHLKEQGVQHIYASDLLRTKETADIIAEETGLTVIYDERLREINLGDYNGLPSDEYHAFFTNVLERFTVNIPAGENLNDVRKRVVAFIKELEMKHEGAKIAVVSHGDPLWMLESAFGSTKDEALLAGPYIQPGEMREFRLGNLPYDELGRLDAHRPFIDDVRIQCQKCAGPMRRVPDVLDVWFDSGAMPFAQWHYPFENGERIAAPAAADTGANFPADFISEAIDQTRGWFYTLIAVSTALGYGTPPYKNVICLGHVLDGKGQKMSKSKGNVVDPFAMIDKYGADAIRFYFATVNQPGEPKRFDEKSLEEVTKKTFLILWNVVSFYELFAKDRKRDKDVKSPRILDKWLRARLALLTGEVTADFETYDIVSAGRRLAAFVNELSTWYVRRSRDDFKGEEGAPKSGAIATLGFALETLAKLMAPITPFLAEALYQRMGGERESVHLESWPDSEKILPNGSEGILGDMAHVQQIVSAALEKRAAVKIPVRQALSSLIVSAPFPAHPWMEDLLKAEVNVHEATINIGEFAVELDTTLTPQLQREGAAREVVRAINDCRKKSGFTIDDRIAITMKTDDDFWQLVIGEHGEQIDADTLSSGVVMGELGDDAFDLTVYEHAVRISIAKM